MHFIIRFIKVQSLSAMTLNILRILAISVMILLSFLSANGSQKYVARDRLLFFSEQFANEVLQSKKDVSDIQKVQNKEVPDSTVYRTLRLFGRSMFERGEQSKAFQYFKQALDILNADEKLGPDAKQFKSYCYLMLGAATDEVGMHQLSVEYCLKGLNICEELNNYRDISKFYNNLGVSFFRAKDYDKAEEYFKKALEINTRNHINLEMSLNYSNLSEISGIRNNIDEAIEYALKAIQCLDEKNNPYDYYSMQTVIGTLYNRKKETHMARSWLENAYKHQKENNYRNTLLYTCIALMELANDTGNQAEFEKYRAEADSIANQSGNFFMQNQFYRSLGNIYRSNGQFEKANQTADKYIAIQDSAYLAENKSRMEQTLNLFNLDKKTKEYDSSIQKLNPLWILLISSAVTLILLGLLLWVIIIRHSAEKARREKEKADAALAELLEQHLQDEIRRNEEASREINDNQRSLTAVTLEKIKTNRTIEEVITDAKQILLSISSRDKANKELLKSIVSRLSSLNNEVNWDEFQYYFVKVHPDFYHRLDEIHSGLTNKDRCLCALISLGLSTKEIAALTFREARSVETSRNRLRKKLELPTDVKLDEYLFRFTTPAQH